MYNVITVDGDQATNGSSDATFVAIDDLAMSFEVEEDEMVCILRVQALASNATAKDRIDFDIKVDGSFVSGNVLGLGGDASAAADSVVWINLSKVVRLAKGAHTIEGWVKGQTDTHVATLHGSIFPTELSVLRLSNNHLLGQGVCDKGSLAL